MIGIGITLYALVGLFICGAIYQKAKNESGEVRVATYVLMVLIWPIMVAIAAGMALVEIVDSI